MGEILVTGASGLVASKFCEISVFKDRVIATDLNDLDITNGPAVKERLKNRPPAVIIHFAAYTDVGKAEDVDRELCRKINVDGTRNLLEGVDPSRTRFIQISTDMVFSGDAGPYPEVWPEESDDSKLTVYGVSKRDSERLVLEKYGDTATILRLIYPVRAKYDLKLDYLRKPLKLFDEGKLYPMFTDQQVSIAFIDEVVLALDKILENGSTGIFHASSADTASPYEIVTYLIEKARGVKNAVKPALLEDFLKTVSSPVRYPKLGGLRVSKTEKELGIKFSSWREIIDKLIEQDI